MKKLPIAYQLYCVRNEMEQDLEGTLKKVKELGFDGVEFAGFYNKTAAEMKALVSEIGLTPISSHVPLQSIIADMDGVIRYHKELGCEYIAIPYLGEDDRPGAPSFAKVLSVIYQFALKCKDAGITLLYHNHDFEFIKVSGIYGLDFIYDAIPEDLLKTEIDTCWVKYAGVDPITYLAQYKGRAPIVHIKDFVSDNSGRTPYALIGLDDDTGVDYTGFSYRPFGHGSQDAEGLLKAAVDAGAVWLVLEQDDPSGASPFEDAKMSMETFARLGMK
ncbi:MAG: sugar phosphate isomerase/epimerase family protein [Christensenellales bacterium]|jgi:sugar phosphate isomerase/epimerase|nr:sugar phosphate isomerase/epimerase [Clostridiales bacterium]